MTTPALPACSNREAFEAWLDTHPRWRRKPGVDDADLDVDRSAARYVWNAALAHARQTPDPSAARIAELEGALRDIARQKRTDEVPYADGKNGDWENAYDVMVDIARAALTPTATRSGDA